MLTFPALHIPDGFLSLHVSAAGWLLLGLTLFVALWDACVSSKTRRLPH